MDDLSSLDWSSKPTSAQPKPPLMNTSFSALRPTPSPLASGRNTPLSAQGSGASANKPPPSKPPQDAFGNLGKFAGSAKSNQNLSLAERQAQLEQEKRRKAEEARKQTEAQFGNGQFWDNLGAGRSSSSTPQPPANVPVNEEDDLFAAFNKDTKVDKSSYYPPPESHRSTPANAAQLDLSNPQAWGSTSTAPINNDDDDPFGLGTMQPSDATQRQTATSASNDDDFLGDLGRPVEEIRQRQQTKQPEAGKPIEDMDESSSDDEVEETPRQSRRNGNDPQDKFVAQLVDYGFSAEDAKRGLAATGGGNVQAAANWLLDDAHKRAKAKAQGRTYEPSESQGQRQQRDGRSPARGSEPDLAKSAAAVGNSFFKTANSLWKTGQKKVQQAMTELQQEGGDPNQPKWMRDAQQGRTQQARESVNVTDEAMMLEAGGKPGPSARDTRKAPAPAPATRSSQASRSNSPAQPPSRGSPAPRWQSQAAPPSMFDAKSKLSRMGGDDDDFAINTRSSRRRPAPQPEVRKVEAEPDLLFNSEAPKQAQSLPQRPAQQAASPFTQTKATVRQPPAATRPTPKPVPSRSIPSISPAALQTSTKHRLDGTAHFKRGDYASAHSSYSASLSALPDKHPLVIVLLTNRALTALKTGEPKQAVTDADSALELIGPSNGQGETVTVKGENSQDEVRDMKELFGKALSRKAEALEQMEKWADAGSVWQQAVAGGVGGQNAIKGRQRCQSALAPKPKPAPRPAAVAPRPRPTASASLAPQKSSEAVTRLREANEAAAKEDDEKFALSEKVDARVAAWRDGKRDNLRALIGSLDTVLWENSGWKKVGLHELVVANKVKISYMKAIAKTHPDKLPQDASTEVRLIAGLVFSTLNESWDKFKADNGL